MTGNRFSARAPSAAGALKRTGQRAGPTIAKSHEKAAGLLSSLHSAGFAFLLIGLLPLRKGRHAFQVTHWMSFERCGVDYKHRLTFSEYSNVSAMSNV